MKMDVEVLVLRRSEDEFFFLKGEDLRLEGLQRVVWCEH